MVEVNIKIPHWSYIITVGEIRGRDRDNGIYKWLNTHLALKLENQILDIISVYAPNIRKPDDLETEVYKKYM